MKKRILAALLTACMLLSLLPTGALAAEDGGAELSQDTANNGELPAPGADGAPAVEETGTGTFTVTGGGLNTDYEYEDNVLTILTGTSLTISGTTTTDRIVVRSGVSADITLDGVSIDRSIGFPAVCAFDIAGATVKLTLKGTNTLKSGWRIAGLHVPGDASLTVTAESTGSLTAASRTDSGAAGIGGNTGATGVAGTGTPGGVGEACGTVNIQGGTVHVDGGIGGGGGGSGDHGNDMTGTRSTAGGIGGAGGTVNICGGTVTVTGGVGGGVGGPGGSSSQSSASGGVGGAGGAVNISGGTVTVTGGIGGGTGGMGGAQTSSGDSGGSGGAGGTVTISGGTVAVDGNIGGGTGGQGGMGTLDPGVNGAAGAVGVFSTGESGCAFLVTSSIDDTDTANWSGVVFQGVMGKVYGSPTISTDASLPMGGTLTVGAGQTLTIAEDTVLTVPERTTIINNGTLCNNGLLVMDGSLTENPATGEGAKNKRCGSFQVTYEGLAAPVYQDGCLTLNMDGNYLIQMAPDAPVPTTDRIVVAEGVHSITLDNVSIDISGDNRSCAFDMAGAAVELTLLGENSFISGKDAAGLRVPEGAALTVTVESTGSLTVGNGGEDYLGAAIGGISGEACGAVTVNGGTVTAIGNFGAGIGGGAGTSTNGANDIGRPGGVVTVNGGKVTAESQRGAGIGGGFGNDAGGAGGTVTVNGGAVAASSKLGAGIGGGFGNEKGSECGPGGEVILSGGIVTAFSTFASGIGGLRSSSDGGTLSGSKNAWVCAGTEHGDSTVNADLAGFISGVLFQGTAGKVYGSPTVSTDASLPLGGTLSVGAGQTLTIAENAMLTVPATGTLTNLGTLQIEGTLINNGTLDNDGTVNNTGTVENGGGTVNNMGAWTGQGPIGGTVNAPYVPPSTRPSTRPSTQPSAKVDGKGGTVKTGSGSVAITSDEGYQISKITVNGKAVDIPKNGKLTGLKSTDKVVVTFEKIPEEPTVDMSKYTDLDAGAWYFEAVRYVVEHSLFAGTSDTTFSPNTPMTRAMLMTVLARADGQDTTAPSGGKWYDMGMKWAVEQGISDGTNPDDCLTREQLAAMLYRYAGSPSTTGTMDGFIDADTADGYATDALKWVVEQGILTGKGNGVLDPKGEATRAEVAAMLMRYLTTKEN